MIRKPVKFLLYCVTILVCFIGFYGSLKSHFFSKPRTNATNKNTLDHQFPNNITSPPSAPIDPPLSAPKIRNTKSEVLSNRPKAIADSARYIKEQDFKSYVATMRTYGSQIVDENNKAFFEWLEIEQQSLKEMGVYGIMSFPEGATALSTMMRVNPRFRSHVLAAAKAGDHGLGLLVADALRTEQSNESTGDLVGIAYDLNASKEARQIAIAGLCSRQLDENQEQLMNDSADSNADYELSISFDRFRNSRLNIDGSLNNLSDLEERITNGRATREQLIEYLKVGLPMGKLNSAKVLKGMTEYPLGDHCRIFVEYLLAMEN